MASVADLVLRIVGKDETSAALASASKGAEGLSNKIGKGVTVAAVVATASVGVLGAQMLGTATDFHNASNTLQTQLGLTKSQTQELGETAKMVYGDNFGASATDAAQVVAQAFQQFGDLGKDQLASITENAFRFKDAFGVDTAQSIDAAKTLMQNFGLTSEQAFDQLAAGFQQGLNRSGDFLDTIGEYSTQFANGGANVDGFFSLLSSGLQGGVLGTDKAADAFKEFRVRIQDGSKATAGGLAALGIDSAKLAKGMADGSITAADAFDLVTGKLRETKDENVRMQAGVALLGTQFEDMGTKAAVNLSLTDGAFVKTEGAAKSLDAQYNTLGSRLETLKRKAEIALLPITDKMQEALPIVANLGQAFAGLSPIIGKSAPLIAKIGPAAASMAALAGPAFQSLGLALLTPPLGIIIALVAAGIAIYIFRDQIIGAIKVVWEKIRPVLVFIRDGIVGAFNAVLNFAREHWPEIATLLSGPFFPIVALATDAFGVRSALTGAFKFVLGFLRDHWPEIATLLSGPFFPIVALATDAFGVRTALVGAFTAMWDKIKEFGGNVKTFFSELPDKILTALGDVSNLLWQKGKDVTEGFVRGLLSVSIPVPSALGGSTPSRVIKAVATGGISELFRASGGPVSMGQPYIVGERGPELFVPSSGGRIVPNNQMSAGGGGMVVNFNGPVTLGGSRSQLRQVGYSIAGELRARGVRLVA